MLGAVPIIKPLICCCKKTVSCFHERKTYFTVTVRAVFAISVGGGVSGQMHLGSRTKKLLKS